MIFFSDILNSKVQDESDVVFGKLEDVAVYSGDNSGYPQVAGVLVKDGKNFFVKLSDIETIGRGSVTLKKNRSSFEEQPPSLEGFVFLKSSVLDKQIVDLAGVRVVRVNDLQFGTIKGVLSLVAIEIGKGGILHRMGLGDIFGFVKPQLIDWKDVRLVGDKLQLSKGVKHLVKLHPADIANIIEKLNLNQGSELLQALDQKTAARVLEELEPEIQRILVESLGSERAVKVIQKMSIDELVDLMQLLPSRKSQEILEQLPSDSSQKVKKILHYDQNTAGGLMTTEYFFVNPSLTVRETIEKLRLVSPMHHSLYFVYLVDESGNFSGVVSLRRLLLSNQDEILSNLAGDHKPLPTATVNQDVLEVASLMTKYNLMSVAILDGNKKILGIVTVDDIMRHFLPHA